MIRMTVLALGMIVFSNLARAGGETVISLDGRWLFAPDTAGAFTIHDAVAKGTWRTISVPGSWQSQCPDLRDYQGVAWYRHEVQLPRLSADQTVEIRFGAVDYLARVYVNGKLAGTHEGGYTPFVFDIREFVKPGLNVVVVRVMDPVASETGTEGISYWNIPHGKQSWYVQTSGIWQHVEIGIVPVRHVASIRVDPLMDGTVHFSVEVKGRTGSAPERWSVSVEDPAGKRTAGATVQVNGNDSVVSGEIRVSHPETWSPDRPRLYRIIVTDPKGLRSETRFGFRKLEARDGKFFLNGKPFYLIAALDQDFYPTTIYSTPSMKYLRDEMRKAKALGLNTLRCHIKAPDPRYLEAADELGLIVWYEIPNWDRFTMDAANRGDATLRGMLQRDWNHPSLCILSLINESWGIDLSKPEQRAWLKTEFGAIKRIAGDRLVVDNSACAGNFHLKTDINDYHTYWAMPERADSFASTIDQVASRPAWLFSPYGDAEQTGKEPLVISEFGNWGLPQFPDQIPWWFGRRFGDASVVLPMGVKRRFSEYGYNRSFPMYDSLAVESQRAQAEALKYEIEEIRLHGTIEGYVITEFTDINWECNGLLDMWRRPKANFHMLGALQQQDVVIPRIDRHDALSGDTMTVRVYFSHYGEGGIAGSKLFWKVGSDLQGNLPMPSVLRGSVGLIGTIHVTLPVVRSPRRVRIDLTVRRGKGETFARNWVDLLVLPRVNKETAGQRSPMVVRTLDSAAVGALERGARVLCLIDSTTRLPADFPLKLSRRTDPWYDGNWASNMNWVRRESPVFQGLVPDRHLGFAESAVMPDFVLSGIAPEHFGDVLAGMYVGWVHLNSGYIVSMRVGKGTLVLCTLRLEDTSDPFARALRSRLMSFTASGAGSPRWRWSGK